MTTYLGYDELESLLSTNWNAVIIAKPIFEDWLYFSADNLNTISIKVDPAETTFATTGTNTRDTILTTFTMKIKTVNKTNADLMLGEVRRIVNAPITNGWRHIDAWERKKNKNKFFIWEINGSETLKDI